MANLCEIIMLLCFGASWPINFRKAFLAKTTKGVSLTFLCLIEIGYLCGMAAKILESQYNLCAVLLHFKFDRCCGQHYPLFC